MKTENSESGKISIKGAIEAILFAAGEPVSIVQLAEMLDLVPDAVEKFLIDLEMEYKTTDRGISLLRLDERVQLASKKDYSDYVKKLATVNERQTLSKGALECLAIIAYKQPVTRVEIDEIRGVSSDYVLSKLLERGFIASVGRKEVPGRPRLYATTDEFLRQFGFEDIKIFSRDESFQELIKHTGADFTEEGDALDEYHDGEDDRGEQLSLIP
ncbi:MAG: SMC-Scp complex subunit ScpB [Clostridiaceae bacterium]